MSDEQIFRHWAAIADDALDCLERRFYDEAMLHVGTLGALIRKHADGLHPAGPSPAEGSV